MQWKQFFTPVESINCRQGRDLLSSCPELTVLDVRQHSEYQKAHLPSAKLIPLPELTNRLDELDKESPILVY